MDSLVLSGADVCAVVRHGGVDAFMDGLIGRLTDAMSAFDPSKPEKARDGFCYDAPAPGLLEWMPYFDGKTVTLKMVGYHPTNPNARGLPTILSTLSAYDAGTGFMTGTADGTLLTALRTGAASAIASRIFAREQSHTLGLIGTGAQAVTQLHAISRVFDLERVLIRDVDDAAQGSFEARVAWLELGNVDIVAAPLDQIIGAADIVCSATSIGVDAGPLFDDVEVQPWVHFNAVGSDFPGKVELPKSLLRQSLVCPDFRKQAIHEGECQQLDADQIGPDLHEAVKRPAAFAGHRERRTVFDSTGWALWDAVALNMALEIANELGIGQRIAVQNIPSDPHNPYQSLMPAALDRLAI